MIYPERFAGLPEFQDELRKLVASCYEELLLFIQTKREIGSLRQFDNLLRELGGVWNLADLTAPNLIVIPSYETPEGKNGVPVQIPIPDNYLPEKLRDFLQNNHGPSVLQKMKVEFNLHIRSRLAQLGIDGQKRKSQS